MDVAFITVIIHYICVYLCRIRTNKVYNIDCESPEIPKLASVSTPQYYDGFTKLEKEAFCKEVAKMAKILANV